ncbi:uncharacterized protein N7482_003295 [Penicillium canariense]|uniref:Uncharacterized protein n=1 Tax=Penicillium canariense TaxID=189055 RepID=A0A9W9I629_9EURO|nr:uncharacterized protein N7482_003295 [Penicillium canariense]KAJ5167701.1 hypothetical protein N7482_003295 [Penicillium canariense]
MVISWNKDQEHRLLIVIWQTCGSHFDWEGAAKRMGGSWSFLVTILLCPFVCLTYYPACTAEAIKQHLRAIVRKEQMKHQEEEEEALHAVKAFKAKKETKSGTSQSNATKRDKITKAGDSYATPSPAKRQRKHGPSSPPAALKTQEDSGELLGDERSTCNTGYNASQDATLAGNWWTQFNDQH